MPRRFALCLIAVVSVAWLAPVAEGAFVRFKDAVVIRSPIVLLGDVAEILDNDPAIVTQLQAVPLVPAPLPGRQQTLAFETIRTRLTTRGYQLNQIEFSGSSLITLSTAEPAPAVRATAPRAETVRTAPERRVTDIEKQRMQVAVGETIVAAVAQQFPHLPKTSADVDLAPEQARELTASGRLQAMFTTQPMPGAQVIAIRFTTRQGELREMPVRCDLQPVPLVITLRQPVPARHTLQAEDLNWVPLPDGEEISQFVTRAEEAIGQETTRALRAGDRLGTGDIQRMTLVRSGVVVTAVARVNGVVVRMEAKARSGGGLGDTVIVETLTGREQLQARIVGFHQVEIGTSPAPR